MAAARSRAGVLGVRGPGGELGTGPGHLQPVEHVDDPVLDHLEGGDRPVEHDAGLGVLGRLLERPVGHPHRLGGQADAGVVEHPAPQGGVAAGRAERDDVGLVEDQARRLAGGVQRGDGVASRAAPAGRNGRPPRRGPPRWPSRRCGRRAPGASGRSPPSPAPCGGPGCARCPGGRRDPSPAGRPCPGGARRPGRPAGLGTQGPGGQGGQHGRGEEGPGEGDPAHLLEHDAGLEQARPRAAQVLGDQQPRSSRARPGPPTARAVVPSVSSASSRRRAGSTARSRAGPGHVPQRLLLGVVGEVHCASGSLTRCQCRGAWGSISHVDFALAPEDEAFRDELRGWLDDHLPPFLAKETPRTTARQSSEATQRRRAAWQRELNEGRWAAIHWPVEYGGRAATAMQRVIYSEVMAEYRTPGMYNPNGIWQIGPMIIAWGTDEQKARWLPEHPQRRRPLVPGLLRARRRQRPGQPADHGHRRRRPTTSSTARRSGSPPPTWPSGASSCCAPTPPPSSGGPSTRASPPSSRHGDPGHRVPAHPGHVGRGDVQRDLLHRRRRAGRLPAGRRGRGLDGGHGHPRPRAGGHRQARSPTSRRRAPRHGGGGPHRQPRRAWPTPRCRTASPPPGRTSRWRGCWHCGPSRRVIKGEKPWPEVQFAKLQWSPAGPGTRRTGGRPAGPGRCAGPGRPRRGRPGQVDPPVLVPALQHHRRRLVRGAEEHHRRPGDPPARRRPPRAERADRVRRPARPCIIGVGRRTWHPGEVGAEGAPEPLAMWEQVADGRPPRTPAPPGPSAALGELDGGVLPDLAVRRPRPAAGRSASGPRRPAPCTRASGVRCPRCWCPRPPGPSWPASSTWPWWWAAEALATLRRLKKAGRAARVVAPGRPSGARCPSTCPSYPAEIAHAIFQAYLTFALFDSARRAHPG